MIELAFVVCLNAEPDTCEHRAMQFNDISVISCTLAAQPELARWVEEHPGWRIQRWTCRPLQPGFDI